MRPGGLGADGAWKMCMVQVSFELWRGIICIFRLTGHYFVHRFPGWGRLAAEVTPVERTWASVRHQRPREPDHTNGPAAGSWPCRASSSPRSRWCRTGAREPAVQQSLVSLGTRDRFSRRGCHQRLGAQIHSACDDLEPPVLPGAVAFEHLLLPLQTVLPVVTGHARIGDGT